MNKRDSEKGAILGFVIIGAVLAVLLIAGLYFSKQQARNASNTPSDTTAQTDTSNSSDTSTSKGTSNAQTLPGDTGTSSNNSSSSTSTQGPIASTGPTEVIATIIGLGLVSAFLAAYFQSSRRLVRAAHN